MTLASDEARLLALARKQADHIALNEQLAWKALLADCKSDGVFKDPKNGAAMPQPHRRPFQRAGAVSARLFGSAPLPVPAPAASVPPHPPAVSNSIDKEVSLPLPLRPKASTADRDFEIVFNLLALADACL
jgi:hypothetical protein